MVSAAAATAATEDSLDPVATSATPPNMLRTKSISVDKIYSLQRGRWPRLRTYEMSKWRVSLEIGFNATVLLSQRRRLRIKRMYWQQHPRTCSGRNEKATLIRWCVLDTIVKLGKSERVLQFAYRSWILDATLIAGEKKFVSATWLWQWHWQH